MTRILLKNFATRLQVEHLEDRSLPSTFTVNTTLDDVTRGNGKFSLREAITKANSTPGADVIVVPAGVFKIALAGAGEDGNVTGDFDITGALTIQGAGRGITFIDGQQLDRAFDVLGSAPIPIKVVFQGLTVRNGSVTGDGGGFQFGNANLVVRDCEVTGNQASLTGGGISSEAATRTGDLKVVRTTIGHNVAGSDGGGILAGAATLTNSTIIDNVTSGAGGGIFARTAMLTGSAVGGNVAASSGGGIFAGATTLTNSTVGGNRAGAIGGGIIAGTVTLTNSTVSGNTAGASGGGGIWATTATLTRSTISGNTAASSGGGISAGMATLTNSTVSDNTAGASGGGIFATTATLLNCTIVENGAHTGGGVFQKPGGTFSMRNTIIALNLVDLTGPDLSGVLTSLGHNLIGDSSGSTGFTNGTNGDIVGTSANPIDPKLGPLANSGGKTKTHALLAGSPAIDHGDNAGVPTSDQRGAGFARKKDGNFDGLAIVDIGAFER